MSNHIHCKVWDEITYPFPNFSGATEVWEWIRIWVCYYLSMLVFKLMHFSTGWFEIHHCAAVSVLSFGHINILKLQKISQLPV